ncbi:MULTISPECIES: class I SAM-dependent methyltransferase [Haloferax]|uniref:Methyltransferase domain-containing protein n=1 Tax=Haloferax marinum TaxID=2666143 RepID=A0A6A8G9A5_9EURY|nr:MULTISPECIES: class I SAM-dependent methyltransferase [Haloferax]KAB1197815.1 class I SAM-dependent methyltransferase [Haloferax sp. CBA1150]MRW96873.1 methyltransferase domain-containing protein [Haloferax marinum]
MDAFQNTRQPDWDWWGRLWPTPGATLRSLGVTPGKSLAEVASGNGYFALPAARITDPSTVYAVDIEQSVLDELDHLADQQAIENVVTLQGDARELSTLLPTRVDVVLVANTFHGVDDKTALVQQVFDSLHDGGEFVVVNWHDRPRETTTVMGDPRGPPTELRMTPDETKAIVEDAADVTCTERVELPPYHYALRFER